MGKVEIRKSVLKLLNNMFEYEHDRKSAVIMNQLIESDSFKKAKCVAVTISRYPEVDTRPIIKYAWQMGKRVAVPKCNARTREMDFRTINSFEDLETVYMDLLEPIESKTKSVRKDEIDLQIVPGVVFSKEGYRIGFGGGYYDRYLEQYKGDSVSLAFEIQMMNEVPVQSHDLPVDRIITENQMIDCTCHRSNL
ncbi:5-formyltetrahydrofolate cyclo-ligase [Sporosarcina sp. Sa2YVA2]|uniref:5-formyltetrahydrofolate cyclo-ligase n=1 Tax=Sporosarcina quadrami TaxID=2762234 RepID=A0ABR8U546_9BACL|nr:5-formyltetrahydrofolate cyclo-ligase [Sporosarcina quadrami]MBD7983155.1 5-formyltetrahydrofolate cyclo-ligase [Sporosarcina quadrami]